MMTPRRARLISYAAGALATLLSAVVYCIYFAREDGEEILWALFLFPFVATLCFITGHSPRLARLCHVLFACAVFGLSVWQVLHASHRGAVSYAFSILVSVGTLAFTLRAASKLLHRNPRAASNNA